VTDRIIRSIPLYGKIAAGTPIEAIADEGETIAVPGEILGAGRHYALSVEGDSMIESGIRDGDIVIIRQTDQAPDGTIVVALVDDQEVTLKTIKRDAGMIHLIPANSQYTPLILPAGNVKIQGVLAGLYRTY
jgi:repressor LexA